MKEMIKRSIFLTIGIVLITLIITFFYILLNYKQLLNLQAEFSKVIDVAPSSLSIFAKHLDNLDSINSDYYIDIKGTYSTEYKSDYANLNVFGEPFSIKNLKYIQVYLRDELKINKNINIDFLNIAPYKLSEINLFEDPRLDIPLYASLIIGPIEISTELQRRRLLITQPAYSEGIKSPAISFIEYNDNSSDPIYFNARLLPYDDLQKESMIIPLNDFKVTIVNDSDLKFTTQIFKGILMREKNFNFIYAKPGLKSKIVGNVKELLYSNLGVPCTLIIKGELINFIIFNKFDVEYKTANESKFQKEKNMQCEIRQATSPLLSIKVQNFNSKQVLLKIQFQSQISNFIINNKTILDFKNVIFNNFLSILNSPYFVGIIAAIYATILVYWVQKTFKKKKKN